MVQAASAFASAGGSAESQLNIPALRLAMVMVLGRAVKESEAESRLHALGERKVPRQPQGRQIEVQADTAKVECSGKTTRDVEVKLRYLFGFAIRKKSGDKTQTAYQLILQ